MRSRLIGPGFLLAFLLLGNTVNAQGTDSTAELVEVPLSVSINKALVLRLPKPAIRVAVSQPQIAEVVILAPDLVLVNGKNVGTTSLLVWFEEAARKSP